MRPFDMINCRAIIDLYQKLEIILIWQIHIYDEVLVIFWILLHFHKSFFSYSRVKEQRIQIVYNQVCVFVTEYTNTDENIVIKLYIF